MSIRFQQNSLVEAAPLQDEAILFHPQSNKFCLLNRTSSFIWLHLQKPVTAEQLAEEVSKGFQDVTITEGLRDVDSVLQEMLSLGLVVSVE
jgi:hypothetical protein